MSSTIDAKNVLNEEKDSFALSDMIGGDSLDVEFLSFGSILYLELRQGAWGAALHKI